jgi:hypothetical protein
MATIKNRSWLAQLDIVKQLPVVRMFGGSFITGYAVWCLFELNYLAAGDNIYEGKIWPIELLCFGVAYIGVTMITHAVWADLRETDAK